MINEISFIFSKNKLGTGVDPQQEACNLPSPNESWLRNKHTGPYALLPLHRRQLTSKIGKRLQLPHVVVLPRQKEILRELQRKGLGLSQNLSCIFPTLSVTLWLLRWHKWGQGVHMLTVPLHYPYQYFLALLHLQVNNPHSPTVPSAPPSLSHSQRAHMAARSHPVRASMKQGPFSVPPCFAESLWEMPCT